MKIKAEFILVLFLAACKSFGTATVERGFDSTANFSTQFYIGKIQRSSLDEMQMYGPKFDSLVKRIVDKNNGKIQECVFQEGKAFLTILKRTTNPLEFEVQDTTKFTKGYLIFSDETLSSWSYNIEVVKPIVGKITGLLSEGNGAKISSDGKMEIRKIWDNKMLIHEIYNPISEAQYRDHLKDLPQIGVSPDCK